jgi:hypothetical protein
MPSQPASGHPASGRKPTDLASLSFLPDEWQLLTRLPARVVIAATSVEADSARRTVAEGLAGLDAIAAGRAFDSDLVRAVVAAIYAENDGEYQPTAQEFTDRTGGIAEVLASCRSVTVVLSARADPADSAAYRQWLQSIAARVCEAARSGGLLGFGGDLLSDTEREFLDELGGALGLT